MRQVRRLVAAAITATALATGLAGCARQVEVRTGESPTAGGPAIEFTNGLAQAVNLYVRPNTGGGEVFVRQVAARTTESIPVRGIAAGSAVTLRAAPVDGSVSYTRENVVLAQGYTWRVP
jgi:hypothetical protein